MYVRKTWNILHPEKTKAGMRVAYCEMRDVPGNAGRLGTLIHIPHCRFTCDVKE